MLPLVQKHRTAILYWLIFIAGCALAVYAWSQSAGTPVEDEIAHQVIARNAWHFPELILHTWGRVGNTLVYMIPALFGLNGARFGALLMSGLTVLITTASARKMGIQRLYLIPLFLWFQPWYPSFGFTAITEIPFLLLLALGLYFFLNDRFALMALCIGWLPLIRHEGILLAGLVFVYLLLTGHKRAALIPFVPLLIYNGVFQATFRLPLVELPLALYFNSQPTTAYGSGPWLYYLPYLIWETGYPIFFWGLIGVAKVVRRRVRGWEYLLLYLSYLLIHAVIYHYGLFASGGYGFFIFPIAPALALLAAFGSESVLGLLSRSFARASREQRRWLEGVAAAVIVVPVLIVAQYLTTWHLNDVESAVQQAVVWAREREIAPMDVIAPHIWFTYEYLYDYPWRPGEIWSICRDLDAAKVGTILVWDSHYSSECGYSPTVLRPGWQIVARYGQDQVIVMRKS